MASAAERRPFWLLVVVTVILDRVTKVVAVSALADGPIPVVGDTVRWQLVYNPGAAFGLGDQLGSISRWIFMAIAIVAVVLLHRMSRESRPTDRLRQLALGFVAGGAAGNLIDRVLSARGVVDFIDVGVGMMRWPTFNVADIAVSCGAVALALSLWLEDARRRDQPAS
jgi:signal peptidase II